MEHGWLDTLLFFGFWAGIIFLSMRLGAGAQVTGHGSRGHSVSSGGRASDLGVRWVAPERDTDPVCGKEVRPEKAKSSVFNGLVHYFCSRECREIFEAAPELYLAKPKSSEEKMETSNA